MPSDVNGKPAMSNASSVTGNRSESENTNSIALLLPAISQWLKRRHQSREQPFASRHGSRTYPRPEPVVRKERTARHEKETLHSVAALLLSKERLLHTS